VNGGAPRTGVKELDSLFRRIHRQGGEIERAAHGWKIKGRDGKWQSFPSSKMRATALRAYRSKLRRMGFDV
jgi:hypothetical protein